MSDLPLFRGEGSIADVMAGRVRRAALLDVLGRHYILVPIDELSARTLTPPTASPSDVRGPPLLLLVQPRRLAPAELVAVDGWIRAGGRALIFTDPWLVWPSRYPLGDPRRPPPVGMLDPLLDHWGLALGDSDGARREQLWDGVRVVTLARGDVEVRAPGAAGCGLHPQADGGAPAVGYAAQNPSIADCRPGQGRVTVVGDADLLEERVWRTAAPLTPQWVLGRLDALSGRAPTPTPLQTLPESAERSGLSRMAMMALAAIALLAGGGAVILRWRRRRKETGG